MCTNCARKGQQRQPPPRSRFYGFLRKIETFIYLIISLMAGSARRAFVWPHSLLCSCEANREEDAKTGSWRGTAVGLDSATFPINISALVGWRNKKTFKATHVQDIVAPQFEFLKIVLSPPSEEHMCTVIIKAPRPCRPRGRKEGNRELWGTTIHRFNSPVLAEVIYAEGPRIYYYSHTFEWFCSGTVDEDEDDLRRANTFPCHHMETLLIYCINISTIEIYM